MDHHHQPRLHRVYETETCADRTLLIDLDPDICAELSTTLIAKSNEHGLSLKTVRTGTNIIYKYCILVNDSGIRNVNTQCKSMNTEIRQIHM